MADKKSFALRINSELMKTLEKWASDEFRSLNGQIEYLLTEAVRKRGKSSNSNTKQIDGDEGKLDG